MMGENVFGNTLWAGHWFWVLMISIVAVSLAWRICQRTGYPGWLGVFILIPIVNLVLLYFIAFPDWPPDETGDRHGSAPTGPSSRPAGR